MAALEAILHFHSTGASTVERDLRNIGREAGRTGGAFSKVGGVANAASNGIIVGIAGAAYASVKASAKFQGSLAQIGAATGASRKEVKFLHDQVLALGSQGLAISPQQAAQALYPIESSGYRGAKAIDMLKAAYKGARITGADLTETTSALAGVMNTHFSGIKNSSQAMAIMNAIVGQGNIKMKDLAASLGTGVLSVLKGAGLGLRDFGGYLDLATRHHIPAIQAATRLRFTLSSLESPTKSASKQLATLGMYPSQLADDLRKPNGLILAFKDLNQHMQALGYNKDQVNNVLATLFGRSRGMATAQLIYQNLDQLQQLQGSLPTNKNAQSALQRQFDSVTKTTGYQFDLLKTKAEELAIRIGDKILPEVNKMMPKIGMILTFLGQHVGTLIAIGRDLLIAALAFKAIRLGVKAFNFGKEVAQGISKGFSSVPGLLSRLFGKGGVAGAAGQALKTTMAVAEMTVDVMTVGSMIGGGLPGGGGVPGGVPGETKTPGGVILPSGVTGEATTAAETAGGAGIFSFLTRGGLLGAGGGLGEVGLGTAALGLGTAALGTGAGYGIQQLTGLKGGLGGTVGGGVIGGGAGFLLGGPVGALIGAVIGSTFGPTVVKFFSDHADEMWGFIKKIPGYIWQGIQKMPGLIWQGIQRIPGLIWDGIQKVPGLVWQGIQKIPGWIDKGLQKLPGWIAKGIDKIPGLIWSVISKIPGLIGPALDKITGLIWGGISKIPGLIWQGIQKIPGLIWQGIQKIPNLIWQGLQKIPNILSIGWKLLNVPLSIANGLVSLPGKIAQGILQGLKNLLPGPVKKALGIGGTVLGVVSKGIHYATHPWEIPGALLPHTGGFVTPHGLRLATGGLVTSHGVYDNAKHFQAGGATGIDNIPAWLASGEGVVNRRGMSSLNSAGLSAVNSGNPFAQIMVMLQTMERSHQSQMRALMERAQNNQLTIEPSTTVINVDGRRLAESTTHYALKRAARGASSANIGGPLIQGAQI